MSFRLSTRQIRLAAASVALLAVLAGSVQGGERSRGRAIEFSNPKSDEVTTNLHQLTSKKDGLKQLEEDLYQPLQSFAPRGSLEGVVAPPPPPRRTSAIQNKRVKELLERRKDWIFMTPEDLLGGPTADEIFKNPKLGPDGMEKQQLDPVERYYQRLIAKRSVAKDPTQDSDESAFGSSDKSTLREDIAAADDSKLPAALRESAQSLSKSFEAENADSPFAQGPAHGTLSDTFGLGNGTPSKADALAHRKFMNEYHALVDTTWHPPAGANTENPFASLLDPPQPAAKPAAGLGGPSLPAAHNGFTAAMDAAYPRLGPSGLPDVNAQALGQTLPAPALPRAEPTRTGPPAPTFEAPKRAFQ